MRLLHAWHGLKSSVSFFLDEGAEEGEKAEEEIQNRRDEAEGEDEDDQESEAEKDDEEEQSIESRRP